MARCLVIHSTAQYSKRYEPLLRDLLLEKPDLFAAVGVDCEGWEEAMDWLCAEMDRNGNLPGAFCNTTSHPGESLEDVLAFAEQWCALKGWTKDVRVVEI
jgi:hypothetical protein